MTEGETFTDGTAVTPINRNRNNLTASAMQAFVKGATCTPAGTLLYSAGVGSSGSPVSIGGGLDAASEELLLKPDTTYAITLTPDAETTCILELFWYEEAGSDPDA